MCVGIPMQVVICEGNQAWCERGGQQYRVDMMLVGKQRPGTWVLVFLGCAREVLSELQALRIDAALRAVDLAMNGDKTGVDRLFADLVDREPPLPDFLAGRTRKMNEEE